MKHKIEITSMAINNPTTEMKQAKKYGKAGTKLSKIKRKRNNSTKICSNPQIMAINRIKPIKRSAKTTLRSSCIRHGWPRKSKRCSSENSKGKRFCSDTIGQLWIFMDLKCL